MNKMTKTAKILFGMLLAFLPTHALLAQDNYTEIQEIISKYYGEWNNSDYPGLQHNRIPNTALMGNGDLGVVSGGNKQSKTFYISKGDFWTYLGSPVPVGGITIREKPVEVEESNRSLSLGAIVAASPTHASYPASRMVNGAWAPGYEGWVTDVNKTAATTPCWADLDLGESKTFKRIVIRHDEAARPGNAPNNTQDFSVSYRNDPAAAWVKIVDIVGNHAAITDTVLEAAVTARYLRLEITKCTQETTNDSRDNPRARIGSFDIYAKAGEIDAPVSNRLHEIEDILHAEVRTELEVNNLNVEMRTFTAATKNIVITELTSKSDRAVELQVTLWAKSDNVKFPFTAAANAKDVMVSRSTPNDSKSTATSHTSKAVMISTVIGEDFTTALSDEPGKADINLTLQPHQTIYLVTAVGGGGRTYSNTDVLLTEDPQAQATALLNTVQNEEAVQILLAEHRSWWQEYWSTSYIKLDATNAQMNTLMKYYYAAQYELGCSIREGKVAPGLYAHWHITDGPSWKSDYHLNYNFISTFYGVNTSNRVTQGLPAIEAIKQYQQEGIKNAGSYSELQKVKADFVAKKMAKGDISISKGIPDAVLYPVGIGPWGMKLDQGYHNEALNASFSAYPLIEYYNYTLDETFLREVLYDYLKLCVHFYESWLEEEGDQYTLYAGYNEGSWAINPAVELSVIKSALDNLIKAAVILGEDADKIPHWQTILSKLAPQPTAIYEGKEVFTLAEKEWKEEQWQAMTNPVPGDGNIIPMESVIPGEQVGYYSPADQLQISKNTIDVFSGRGAWAQNNNFPKIYTVAVNTRYPVQTIVEKMASTIQSKMQLNLMIEDNTHGVEKAGATEAINNLMLLSDRGVITVFPGWISTQDAKFVSLREKGAFVVSSEYSATAQEVLYIDLVSEAGKPATVASPWAEGIMVHDQEGHRVLVYKHAAPNHPDEFTYTFNTAAGKSYHLVKSDGDPDWTAVKQPVSPVNIAVYPNPVLAGASISIDAGLLNDARLMVYNTTGQLIHQTPISAGVTQLKAATNPGVYLYVVSTGNSKKVVKVVCV
ncbi:hypothetical protein EZS27_000729 [termite gut metagenome]|uniref:F5/8 type C domain-containing protein n=1 Tax=termite gut metagenome TaxID=433724 RepID=A0A5J4T217_9ZZZZ